jgi:hypothetical protein
MAAFLGISSLLDGLTIQAVYSMKRLWPLLLAVVAAVGATGNAQTLHVRLLDGRSGKPIAKGGVNVWVGDHRKAAVPIPGDRDGIAKLSLTNIAGQVNMEGRPSDLPAFLYAPEIRIQVGFVLCQAAQKKFSWLQIMPYSTEDWTRTGIVTANTCGRAVAKPEPGELTIFVRPLNFWERMSE